MTTEDSAAPGALMAPKQRHIVEELIDERTQHVSRHPLWPLAKLFLFPLLKHNAAKRMADTIHPLGPRGVFEAVSQLLDLDVVVEGIENIPREGRVMIAPNHPTGIADGIAVFDALKDVRPDLCFFANRDAIRVAPLAADIIIPVEWVVTKRTRERTRETLASTVAAFQRDRCIILFPSGRLAFMNEKKELTEQPWQNSIAIFARKYECPVVPAYIDARNSPLYYFFWKINTELRDMTLFNELLNKRKKRYPIRFGAPIAPDSLPDDPVEAAAALRHYTAYELPKGVAWEDALRGAVTGENAEAAAETAS